MGCVLRMLSLLNTAGACFDVLRVSKFHDFGILVPFYCLFRSQYAVILCRRFWVVSHDNRPALELRSGKSTHTERVKLHHQPDCPES